MKKILLALFLFPYLLVADFWESKYSLSMHSVNHILEINNNQFAFNLTQNDLLIYNQSNSTEIKKTLPRYYSGLEDYIPDMPPSVSEAVSDGNGNLYLLLNNFQKYYANTKLIKSTNQGDNWEEIYETDDYETDDYITNLIIDEEGILYAITRQRFQPNYGFVVSSDGGSSWARKRISGVNNTSDIVRKIGQGNDRIYVMTRSELYFALNNGNTIVPISSNELPTPSNYTNLISHKESIIIENNDKDSLYYSNNAGISWVRFEPSGYDTSMNIRKIVSLENKVILSIDDYGLFEYDNTGNRITHIGIDLAYKYYTCEDIILTQEGNLIASVLGSGVYKSSDGGENWELIYKDNSPRYSPTITGIFSHDNQNIIATSNMKRYGFLFRSSDFGDSWEFDRVSSELAFTKFDNIGEMIFASNSDTASGKGLFYSTDRGHTWSLVQPEFESHVVFDIFVNRTDDIYACPTRLGVIRSSDGGDLWFPVDGQYPEDTNSTAFFQDSKATIYSFVGEQIYYKPENDPFWLKSNMTSQLVNLARQSPIYDFDEDSEGNIYAIAEHYLLKSTDGAKLFSPAFINWIGGHPSQLEIDNYDNIICFMQDKLICKFKNHEEFFSLEDGFKKTSNFDGNKISAFSANESYLFAAYGGKIYKRDRLNENHRFASLEAEPNSISMDAEQEEYFLLELIDNYGNPVPDATLEVVNQNNQSFFLLETDSQGKAGFSFYASNILSKSSPIIFEIKCKDERISNSPRETITILINPGGLKLKVTPEEPQEVVTGESYSFNFFLTDEADEAVSSGEISFFDPIASKNISISTNNNGAAQYATVLEEDMSYGKKNFVFTAEKDFLQTSQPVVRTVNASKPRLKLNIQPAEEITANWGEVITYEISVSNEFGEIVPNAQIEIFSLDQNFINTTIVSDETGKAIFQDSIPDKFPSNNLTIFFGALEPNHEPSAVTSRRIKIESGQKMMLSITPEEVQERGIKDGLTNVNYDITISNHDGSTPSTIDYTFHNPFAGITKVIIFGVTKFPQRIEIPDTVSVGEYLVRFDFQIGLYPLETRTRIIKIVDSISSVQELLNEEKIKLYPNPSSNELNISLPNDINLHRTNYKIFDIRGILIAKYENNKFGNIDISNLPVGSYYLVIECSKANYLKKFIIER